MGRALPSIAEEELQRFAVEPGWRYGERRRIAWSDVDAFGHCNHLALLRYCEDARNGYLEAIGLPRLGFHTPGPVLGQIEARYLLPLSYGDEVLVTARSEKLGRTSLRKGYAVWTAADGGGCAARCTALCVLMINATGEKVALPDELRATIVALDDPQR